MRCYRNKTKGGVEIMNEKRIQEVMVLVNAYAKAVSQGAALTVAGFDVRQEVQEVKEARAAIESALREQVREVPERWKPVPVEPTDAMVQAAHHLDLSYMPGQEGADRAAIYRAMLSAAPTQPAQAEQPKAATPWPISPDVAAELERCDWTPEEALRWYAAGRHYDTVPNGDGTSSARILDNGAVASNALKSLSIEYAMHKGDVALLEPKAAQQEPFGWWKQGETLDESDFYPASDFPDHAGCETCIPLYTAAPQREPMTDEQVAAAADEEDNDSAFVAGFHSGVRYAERFHCITKRGQK